MIKFCSLYSSSSGNSSFVSSGKCKILIDAGLSAKRIEKAIEKIAENPREISAILVTHEHSDHVKGVGIFSRKYDIPIYANWLTWEAMKNSLGEVEHSNMRVFETDKEFVVGDFDIKAFSIPHDGKEPVGFSFHIGGKKLTTATDIGHINPELTKNLEASDIVLLESNHDEDMLKMSRYPWFLKKRIMGDTGHLCNEVAGKIVKHLVENGTKKFVLGHLSRENNFPELVYETVKNVLDIDKIVIGKDLDLIIAKSDDVSEVMTV